MSIVARGRPCHFDSRHPAGDKAHLLKPFTDFNVYNNVAYRAFVMPDVPVGQDR
jgi:hypothetical protein